MRFPPWENCRGNYSETSFKFSMIERSTIYGIFSLRWFEWNCLSVGSSIYIARYRLVTTSVGNISKSSARWCTLLFLSIFSLRHCSSTPGRVQRWWEISFGLEIRESGILFLRDGKIASKICIYLAYCGSRWLTKYKSYCWIGYFTRFCTAVFPEGG